MIYQPIVYEQASEESRVLYDEILETLDLEALPNWVIYMGSNIEVLSGGVYAKIKGPLGPFADFDKII